jgi:hypothetical protein
MAFPEELTPVHKYRSEDGYWEDLQKRVNKD